MIPPPSLPIEQPPLPLTRGFHHILWELSLTSDEMDYWTDLVLDPDPRCLMQAIEENPATDRLLRVLHARYPRLHDVVQVIREAVALTGLGHPDEEEDVIDTFEPQR